MRTSKLQVLVKLARHEERQALRVLGEARMELDRLEQRLADLHAAANASMASALEAGIAVAGDLAAQSRHRQGLRTVAIQVASEREAALETHDKARDAVAAARMRVRSLENAIERREAREKLERARADVRRIDEAVRARLSISEPEDSDALA